MTEPGWLACTDPKRMTEEEEREYESVLDRERIAQCHLLIESGCQLGVIGTVRLGKFGR
jgi:hypothetical protein